MKKYLTGAFLLLASPTFAQDYYVIIEQYSIKLYKDYVNDILVEVRHARDTSVKFRLEAEADGADLSYDQRGRMKVLPRKPQGKIRMYAISNGKTHRVGEFEFEAIQAPGLDDGTFIDAMGITKDDPKTSLKDVNKFSPQNAISTSEFVMHGFRFFDLPKKTSEITVQFLRKDPTYAELKGDVTITSPDATIKKIGRNRFVVTPLPTKRRCALTFFNDGKQIGVENLAVHD